MMNTKQVMQYARRTNPGGVFSKKDIKDNIGRPMKDNIYEDQDLGKHLSKWKRIHKHFKLWVLAPALHFSKRWLLPKKLVIPNTDWNKNMLIFDEAFEDSMRDWCDKFLCAGKMHIGATREEFRKAYQGDSMSVYCLRIMKEHVLNMCLNDTAYREFLNMFMFSLANKMNTFYNKEDYPDAVGHLFYAQRDPYDVHYKILFKFIRQQTQLSLEDVVTILRDHEQKQAGGPIK